MVRTLIDSGFFERASAYVVKCLLIRSADDNTGTVGEFVDKVCGIKSGFEVIRAVLKYISSYRFEVFRYLTLYRSDKY